MLSSPPAPAHATREGSLSDEQQGALERIVRGENLLITGTAGTGKSHLLHHLRALLNPVITASTGVSAIQLHGETIHSWAGLGLCDKSPHEIVAGIYRRAQQWGWAQVERIRAAKILVVDEVSMLSADVIDTLDGVLSLVRENEDLFGGLQMVLVGDFLQLPPVSKDGEVAFAFEADAWKQANIGVAMLTKVYRQEEEHFSRILGKIRMDEIDDEVISFLEERYHAEDPDPEHPACILHTHNAGCDRINAKMLAELPGAVIEISARDYGSEKTVAILDRDCMAPKKLRVKPGARVMLLRNLDLPRGLANGSMGHVEPGPVGGVRVRFDNGVVEDLERARWELIKGGDVVASREQIPLRLARAVTIHRIQGLTLDKVEAHIGKCFSPGQGFVALSRARTSAGLFLRGSGAIIEAHPKAVQFYKECLSAS